MLKNGQRYYKNLAVFAPPDFKSIFDHFLVLHTKGLKVEIKTTDGRSWHRSDLFIGPFFSS